MLAQPRERNHTLRSLDRLAAGVTLGVPAAVGLLISVAWSAQATARSDQATVVAAPAAARSAAAVNPGAAQAIADDCASCHKLSTIGSHPVGVIPALRIPASMPLVAGKIGCTTCHDPAAAADHAGRKPAGRTFLREEDRGGSLCAACHTSDSGRTSPHANSHTRVHAPKPSLLGKSSGGRKSELDAESRSCMGCHDGSTASDAGSHTIRSMSFEANADHPVGVKYKSRPAGDTDAIILTPIASLDKRVRLFDERVGCNSCHNVFSREKKLLVMDNKASRLCLACHVE